MNDFEESLTHRHCMTGTFHPEEHLGISAQTLKVVLQQPSLRAIHPNIEMHDPDFLNGYAAGLKNGLHPDGSGSHIFTDEEMIDDLKESAREQREVFAYVLGCYIGGLIARCYSDRLF